MMEREQNSRTRRTKGALRAALAALIRERGLTGITVRELTTRAGINRATFYIHYHDIHDMLEKTHHEILNDLGAVLRTHQQEESAERPLVILEDVFRFLQKHSDICSALMCENGDPLFIEALKKPVREKTVRDWTLLRPNGTDAARTSYFATFIVSGVVALFEQWYQTGMQETPEEMAELADAFIRVGSQSLKEANL